MNKLTSEKCREQFEEWFADHAGQTVEWVKSQRSSDTHYKIGPEIQGYWLTWQASREAFEIALPILEQQDHEKSIIAEQLEAVRDSLALTPHQNAIISCAIDRLNVLTSRILELSRSLINQQERKCQKCGGTGEMDSGSHTAGGKKIMVKCDCQQDRGEGEWVEWYGNRAPVDPGTSVQVRWKDGEASKGKCWNFHWGRNCGNPIIAYRIIPERATNQNGER